MKISIDKLCAGYPEKPVLKEISIDFPEQGFCALLGPNGAGKSTLLKTMVGFLPMTGGDILYDRKSLHDWHRLDLARKIAMIPQELEFQFDYLVRELVLMGRFPYLSLWQNYSARDEEITDETLERLHLTSCMHKHYLELSGGEKQRVLIVRALVQQTEVILLDESLSQLDINYQVEIMNLLRKIASEQGKLVILVSHNINLAANYCDSLYFLKDGTLAANGKPSEVVNSDQLFKLYGIELEVTVNPETGIPSFLFPYSGKVVLQSK